MVKYIDEIYSAKSGKHLVPTDSKHKALVEQWLSVDHDNYQPYAKAVVAEKMHWYGPNPDEEKVKAANEKFQATLDSFEAHLAAAKSTYLVGNEFTAADLSFLPYTALYYSLGGEFAAAIDSRPHVSAWWKAISSHPAWIAASTPPKH
jgi:glutathione S-transferase